MRKAKFNNKERGGLIVEVTNEKFKMLRALFVKVDFESLISHGANEDIYDEEIRRILIMTDTPKPKQIQNVIQEVFWDKYGYNPDNSRYGYLPKLSSDVFRVLILDEFKTITKITIDYYVPEYSKYSFCEKISIDGEKEEINYIRQLERGRKITNSFYIPHFVSSFIEEYALLFQYFGECDYVYSAGKPYVEINVFTEDGEETRIIRMYNRHGIPQEWNEFIDDLGTMLYSFGMFGDLFNAGIYENGVLSGEYIFLSVRFNEHGKEYYYLTTDDDIKAGDAVVVPVGDSMKKKLCIVTRKQYFKPDCVPMPIEKVKTIISRFDNTKIVKCPLTETDIDGYECYFICEAAEGNMSQDEMPCMQDYDIERDICLKCKFHGL